MPAVPKPSPRWMEKAQKRAAEVREMRASYAEVDRRDGPQCRVCKAHIGGLGQLERRHHHHLAYRSVGGDHQPANILSLCVRCHQAVHDADIRLTGDANLRSPEGTLCGVVLERYTEGGWRKERVL